MKFMYKAFVLILVLSMFLAGCNTEQKANSNEKNAKSEEEIKPVVIYTTIFPLRDFTQKIGGNLVSVESIIPAGADAHTYEPTSKQMMNIAEADAFIFNGLGIESFAEKISTALENEKVKIVEASSGIQTITHVDGHGDEHSGENSHHEEEHAHEEEEHAHEEEEHAHEEEEQHSEEKHEHAHGDFDPHIWLDPYRAITLAENIKNALVELMPDAEETFNQNFELLKQDLEELDSEFHQLIESKSHREILVSHAAYGYWENSYGIKQIAVAGLSPTDEPSQKELENIIKIAQEKQIKYVIFEQNVSQKVAEIIRKELNAETLLLHNLEAITDEDIKNNEDYFSIMRNNLKTLDTALD